MGGARDQVPPDVATLRELDKRRQQASKALIDGARATVKKDADAQPFAKRALTLLSQMSVEPDGQSALAVPRETREAWCDFEQWFHSARGWLPANVSPIRFLAVAYCIEWTHELEKDVAYKEIYARDGQRCQSPLCTCRHKTPHHLRFRAHGSDDDPENVVTLCAWCHLFGVHEGIIKAKPPASDIHWQFGRDPILAVEGRRKIELDQRVAQAA